MQILAFNKLIASARGKMANMSDWWVVRRYKKYFTGHKNRPRDYKNNPVTPEERKTLERLRLPAQTYHNMDKNSEEYRQLVAEFEAQKHKKNGIHSNVYCYYMHREMLRMKQEGEFAADSSQNLKDWSHKKHK